MSIKDRIFRSHDAKIAARFASAAREAIVRAVDGMAGRSYFGQKWAGGLSSSDPTLTIDHARMRKQARVITQTSQQAAALMRTDVDTTIDSGLVVAPEPRTELLGITPEEGERWGNQVRDGFDLWAQSKRSTRSGMLNFYQAQRLMRLYRARDNECFIRHYYNPNDPSLVSPLQFEIIDPDQIRGEAYTATSGLLAPNDGIERDSMGQESGYKIWSLVAGTIRYESITIPRTGPKSGRVFMTHGFDPEFAGQGRGFSALGISIQELDNLLDFTSAQIKKAINQSNIYLVGKSSSDRAAVDPLAGFTGNGAGPAALAFGSIPTPPADAQNVTPESLAPVYTPLPTATINTPGSVGVFLDAKNDLTAFQNSAPSDSYDSFVDAYFAYIAAAQGTPIEVVLKRFSANYSASRATLILAWRVAIQRRYQLACDHLDPLYECYISLEIAAGRLSAPGWQDPRLRAAWLAHRWVGSSMPNIDPVATMKASQIAAQLGATTLDDIATEYNGSSGKSNRAKLTREYAELPGAPWAAIPAAAASPPDPEAKPGEGETNTAQKKQGGNQ